MDIYDLALIKADQIESELKQLHRWMEDNLPDEAFTDMGAFGSNTMSFEQWLQFVLLPRIREIVAKRDEFPASSQLASYAVHYFDGDHDSAQLQRILYELDQLINEPPVPTHPPSGTHPPTVLLGDTKIPEELYLLADQLPNFSLNNLESQLQTFDTFLGFLSPVVRPAISRMLQKAADRTIHADCKKRIEQAALDVAEGKRAAAVYNFETEIKKIQEEHRKNFPPSTT